MQQQRAWQQQQQHSARFHPQNGAEQPVGIAAKRSLNHDEQPDAAFAQVGRWQRRVREEWLHEEQHRQRQQQYREMLELITWERDIIFELPLPLQEEYFNEWLQRWQGFLPAHWPRDMVRENRTVHYGPHNEFVFRVFESADGCLHEYDDGPGIAESS